MPEVGIELRRVTKLSVEEWAALIDKFESLMKEIQYKKRDFSPDDYAHKGEKTERHEWFNFFRLCASEDMVNIRSDVPNRDGYLGCRWYSFYFSADSSVEDLFVPWRIWIRPGAGWGSYFIKDDWEMILMEKIEINFLGPFRTYYKCLTPVAKIFRAETERQQAQENGFALAVLMDRQLRNIVFPICQR